MTEQAIGNFLTVSYNYKGSIYLCRSSGSVQGEPKQTQPTP